MITMIRSAAIAPGKGGDAITFAHTVAKHIHSKYGVKLTVSMPIGGNPNRIGWSTSYENLADWEAFSANLMADPDYLAAVAANSATFIAGSVHDDLWRSI